MGRGASGLRTPVGVTLGLGAFGCSARRGPRYVLGADRAGAGLFLGDHNPDLEASRDAIDLQTVQAGPSLAIGGGDLGAQPVDEHAARTVLGEMKADRRTGHRLARSVRYFYGKRAGVPG